MALLETFFTILTYALMIAIFGRVIMSFIDPMSRMPLSRLFYELTEPILAPIRKVVPTVGMFDFSPIIALLILQVLQRLVSGLS